MVVWPPTQAQLSSAGLEFILNPTRTGGNNLPNSDYWRTVTEIYFRLHNEITSTAALEEGNIFEWYDPIFCDSFENQDRGRGPDPHRFQYQQAWRQKISQIYSFVGSNPSRPFCTTTDGGRPLIIPPEARAGLIERTSPYVVVNGEDGIIAELPNNQYLPQSNLDMNGETMFRRSLSPEGWIYILTHPAFENWIKIGKTRNLSQRLSSYNTGTPNDDNRYVIQHHFPQGNRPHPNALSIELELHRLQAPDRVPGQRREWYPWSVEEAMEQVLEMVEHMGAEPFENLDQQMGDEELENDY